MKRKYIALLLTTTLTALFVVCTKHVKIRTNDVL